MPTTDFINLFKEWTREGEAPTTYWEAAALAALAGAAERKVWYEQGVNFENLYPNLYLVLVGPPATHKGSAAKAGMRLLRRVQGVNIVPAAITPEQFYIEMVEGSRVFRWGDDYKEEHSSATLFSTEWNVFLSRFGLEDQVLEKLYDCEEVFDYHTKHQGKDDMYNVFFNMFACIQPTKLGEILPYSAVGSGFTSRIILVVENNKRHRKAEPEFNKDTEQKLITILQTVNKATGPITADPEASKWYKFWYENESENSPLIRQPKFTYYIHRKPQHLLKIAMLMSLSRTHGADLTISREDFRRAQIWLNNLEVNMPEAFGGFGANPVAQIAFQVEKFIKAKGVVNVKDLLSAFWEDLNWAIMDRIITDLKIRGLVERIKIGNDYVIRWRKE